MVVPPVYGCSTSVWLSHQCMIVPLVYDFPLVYDCPTSVCMVVPPVYGFSAGVWLSYRCTAVLHVHGCPTCVWLSQQVLYNLSERCKPVLPVFVQLVLVYGCPINVCNFFRTMYGFPNSVIQPVRTVYDCPTSAGTTCLNTVLLFYQSLYNLSEHCIVVLPVLVQLV